MHIRSRLRLVLLLLGVLGGAAHAPAGAQQHPLQEARALREAGNPAAALPLVREFLARAPDDPGARWLLAQLLVESGDHAAALPEFEHALRLDASPGWLHLEYAQALVATRRFRDARAALAPLDGGEGYEGAAAEALLGSLDYWRGDLAAAARRFRRALDLQPDHAEAARQLQEIRDLTAPLIRSAARHLSDNQPLSRTGGELAAAFFPHPHWRLGATLRPEQLQGDRIDGGRRVRPSTGAVEARASIAGHVPGARLEPSLDAGVAYDAAEGAAAVGEAALGVRLPGAVTLRAAAGRDRYLGTVASLDTLLVYRRAELRLDRAAAPGWAGEGVLRAERFPDANVVRTAYAWVLAPVLPGVRAGLSSAWQDSDASTWTEAAPVTPLGRGGPTAGTTGIGAYDPYYTPHAVRTQAVLGEIALGLEEATLRVSGSYGFHARERAPAIRFTPFPPFAALEFEERAFTPWRAGASLDLPVSPGTHARVEVEHETTAFYEVTRFRLATTWRPRVRPYR